MERLRNFVKSQIKVFGSEILDTELFFFLDSVFLLCKWLSLLWQIILSKLWLLSRQIIIFLKWSIFDYFLWLYIGHWALSMNFHEVCESNDSLMLFGLFLELYHDFLLHNRPRFRIDFGLMSTLLNLVTLFLIKIAVRVVVWGGVFDFFIFAEIVVVSYLLSLFEPFFCT